MDAVSGGVDSIMLGTWIFAVMYPKLKEGILKKGNFGELTFLGLFKVNDWVVVISFVVLIVLFLFWTEQAGL